MNKIQAKAAKIIDDFSYVSKIELCRADSSGTAISGVKVTWTNFKDGTVTNGVLDGYTNSDCPVDKVVELAANDCITRFNVVFDANGNGHSVIYRRRMGESEESLGFGTVTASDFSADDVPTSGCLSGYNMGWYAPATTPTTGTSRYGRNLAEANIVTLQGIVTISSDGIQEDLMVTEIEVSALAIAEERIALELANATNDLTENGGNSKYLVPIVIIAAIAAGVYYFVVIQ